MINVKVMKSLLEECIQNAFDNYVETKRLEGLFLPPIVSYAFQDDPLFMALYDLGIITHPKLIYRPGNVVIVHFIPYNPDFVYSLEGEQKNIKQENWIMAYEKSIMLSAHINGEMQRLLYGFGRESSLSTLITDWDYKKFAPDWSHKLAALVAGMGDLDVNGSIKTEVGAAGRFSSLFSELKLVPNERNILKSELSAKENMDKAGSGNAASHYKEAKSKDIYQGIDLDEVKEYINRQSLFPEAIDLKVPEDIIRKCPANAISSKGIDRKKCQDYCSTLNQTVPSPDACGMCYHID